MGVELTNSRLPAAVKDVNEVYKCEWLLVFDRTFNKTSNLKEWENGDQTNKGEVCRIKVSGLAQTN